MNPVPCAVPLCVKDPLCHLLQGQKISITAAAIIDGKNTIPSTGDLLFTKYGLSGTSILDISESISIALNRDHKKDITVVVDLVPFMTAGSLQDEITRRIKNGTAPEEMLVGILPNKFAAAFKDMFKKYDSEKVIRELKEKHFKVTGTRGWNEAEFTAGGVNVSGIKEATLESKLRQGLYFAGEILDVNGRRGGYNLAWAWASGYVAGRAG